MSDGDLVMAGDVVWAIVEGMDGHGEVAEVRLREKISGGWYCIHLSVSRLDIARRDSIYLVETAARAALIDRRKREIERLREEVEKERERLHREHDALYAAVCHHDSLSPSSTP